MRYDRRGHSRSTRGRAAISVARHADDAAALIEALELAPCLLVGSSGGASIGVDVALRHGHLLRGAVFSEPPLFSLDPAAAYAARRQVAPVVETAIVSGDHRAFVDEFFALICPGLWSTIDETRKDRYRANADIGLTDLQSLVLDVTPGDLTSIACPVLLIGGTTSHHAHWLVTHRLAAALPDARLVELDDCGHVTYAEQPDAFARAVATFAAELDRRPAVVAP